MTAPQPEDLLGEVDRLRAHIQSLEEENRLLRQGQPLRFVEYLPDGLFGLDLEGRVQFVNQRGQERLGLGEGSSPIGRPWLALWPEPLQPLVGALLESARQGEPARAQIDTSAGEPRPRWWDVQLTAVRD